MSDGNLRLFLEKLHKELSKSSEVYRRNTSNIQVHEFGVKKKELIENTIGQIRADGISLDDEDIRYITAITTDYYEELRAAFTTGNTDRSYITDWSNRRSFKVTITPKRRKKTKKNKLTKTDVFKSIAAKKQRYQDEFYTDIHNFYIENNRRFEQGAFLDITHQGTSAVSKQQVAAVSEKLAGHGTTAGQRELLEGLGIDLTVTRKQRSVEVSIGGAEENRQKDGKGEQADKRKYKEALQAAIDKLKPADVKSSDSLRETARKDAVNIVMTPFSKLKGVKVKKEDTKPKKPSGKPITKKIRPEVTSAGSVAYINNIPEPPKPKTDDSPINLQALIPTINMRLADVIAGNMGSPALNYQTGRFAESAKVTDITTTRQGYPSIGYTYMKNPYQLYESPGGSPSHATPARDPRLVIGQSIREIARGLINQRFYTRRN